MHPLYEYIAGQLAERLRLRKILVWYDPAGEFASFVAELRGGPRLSAEPVPVTVGGVTAQLLEFDGSMLELRATVEPLVEGDEPGLVLLYIPGRERDRRGSLLMELEKGGECFERELEKIG